MLLVNCIDAVSSLVFTLDPQGPGYAACPTHPLEATCVLVASNTVNLPGLEFASKKYTFTGVASGISEQTDTGP